MLQLSLGSDLIAVESGERAAVKKGCSENEYGEYRP